MMFYPRKLVIVVAGLIALSGCASVQTNPSLGTATTLASFEANLGGLGARIELPSASRLAGAEMDGKRAYCTIAPAYFHFGERRSICLIDQTNSGYFDEYYVLGTLRSLTYPAHVPYSVGSPPAIGSAGPTVEDVRRCADESSVPYNPLLGIVPLIVQMVQEKSTRDMCLSAAAAERS